MAVEGDRADKEGNQRGGNSPGGTGTGRDGDGGTGSAYESSYDLDTQQNFNPNGDLDVNAISADINARAANGEFGDLNSASFIDRVGKYAQEKLDRLGKLDAKTIGEFVGKAFGPLGEIVGREAGELIGELSDALTSGTDISSESVTASVEKYGYEEGLRTANDASEGQADQPATSGIYSFGKALASILPEVELLGSDATTSGDTTKPLLEQALNLYQGGNPTYNINELSQQRQDDFTNLGDTAAGLNATAQSQWDAFSDYYRNQGLSLTTKWEDISAAAKGDSDALSARNEQLYGDIRKGATDEFSGIRDQYDKSIGGIPTLGLKMPSFMGGGAVPLAPGKWGDYYGNIANTQGGLAKTKWDTNLGAANAETGNAQNIFSGKYNTLTNSLANQGNLLTQGMNTDSTALSNKNTLAQQTFANNAAMLGEKYQPLDYAQHLIDAQLGIQAQAAGVPKPYDPSTLDYVAKFLSTDLGQNMAGTGLDYITDIGKSGLEELLKTQTWIA